MTRGGKRSRRLTKRQLSQKYASARKELRVLRSKGLVSPRANLSKAKPSSALLKKLEALRPVITGDVQAVRVPRSKAKEYSSSGYKVINNRVLVPVQPGENATYRPSRYVRGKYVTNDTIRVTGEKGTTRQYLERILIPLDFQHFQEFNAWLQEDPDRLQRLLPDDAIIGFTYFGNRSQETGDAHWLAQYLQHYSLLFDNEKSDDAFGTLEFWGMSPDMAPQWEFMREQDEIARRGNYRRKRNNVDATGRTIETSGPRTPKGNAQTRREYRQRIMSDPEKAKAFKAREAKRVSEYKKRIKNAFTFNSPGSRT